MHHLFVCQSKEINEGQAKGFRVYVDENNLEVIVVKYQGEIMAYENRCPHFSVSLDNEPNHFYTYKSRFLMCAHHSAMFNYVDGVCVDGPCKGASLTQYPVRVVDDCVFIHM